MTSKVLQVQWDVNSKTVTEQRVTSESPIKFAQRIWSIAFREYPITDVRILDESVPPKYVSHART